MYILFIYLVNIKIIITIIYINQSMKNKYAVNNLLKIFF